MRIKLLIATADSDYAEHLSNVLAEKYAEVFEVSVCTTIERFGDVLAVNTFDAALLAPDFASASPAAPIRFPLILTDESLFDDTGDLVKIRKYQRVSSLTGQILELCAEISGGIGGLGAKKARVSAVWSPSGGSGKTTVALAYAAKLASKGKAALYLNLENFSSTSVYFADNGRSISKAFEKLESNVNLIFRSIRQQDSGTGIFYFCGPENYDDINILTADDIELLLNACAADIDELIIDLPSVCDERIQKIMAAAGAVFLVCDPTLTSQVKLRQFMNQHNVYEHIRAKIVLVCNKGAKTDEASMSGAHRTVRLPRVQSADPVSVYKTLSSGNFDIGDN